MGRKKLPQEVLDLRGTARPDRQRPSSVIGEKISVGELGQKCQVTGLRGVTKRANEVYWRACRKVAATGMLEEAFLGQLLMYAVEVDHFITCCEDIRKNGLYIQLESKKGPVLFANPAVKQRDNALDRICKIGSNFGFSPVDRQRIKLVVEDPADKKIKGLAAIIFADDEETDNEYR